MYSPANNNGEQASGWGLENNAGGGFFKGGGAWKTIGNPPNRVSYPEQELQIPDE